jgi:hypothetical protein
LWARSRSRPPSRNGEPTISEKGFCENQKQKGEPKMKLGETKEFWVLRKAGTEEYYCEPANTKPDILEARRFTEHEERDTFKAHIAQAAISAHQTVPALETVRIRIKTEQAL